VLKSSTIAYAMPPVGMIAWEFAPPPITSAQ
jgi:hypothetical protein